MIIRTRNRILLAITFISLATLIGMAILTGIQFYNGSIKNGNAAGLTEEGFFLFRKNIYAVILSVFVLLTYNLTVLFFINVQFEKTQSSEIIYFSLFLTAVLFDASRLFVPCYNLWTTFSQNLTIISRLTLFGHILAPISILYVAIQNLPEHRQNIERNLLILVICSIIFAVTLPLNSGEIMFSGRLKSGFETILNIFWLLTTVVTFISLLLNNYNANTKTLVPLGILLLLIGHKTLTNTENFTMLITGSILLISGTCVFLKDIHKQYLWN